MSDDGLVAAVTGQARVCAELNSPFGAAFLDRVGADLAGGGPVGALFSPWRDNDRVRVVADAPALRLLAAFHELALSGEEPALTRLYPAAAPTTDWPALWPLIEGLATRRRERLADFMTHEPQTNEVRRSICLLGGFLTVAAETGLPLRCLELGASAGLILNWDRFAYRLGEAAWGDPRSPVRLDTDWRGPPPPLVDATVIDRAGCDRRPARLDDPQARRRLTAYVWADQPERLERLNAAAELAQRFGATVDAADAADWLDARLDVKARVATVVYHSSFWQYPPESTRERLRATLAVAGARATAAAPLAWLRKEPSQTWLEGPDEVKLTTWPDGATRLLAHVHPHGAFVHWLA